MEKIDILVVTYNQEKFIIECVNSILNQTYSNISIKIFDDCSTDSTKELLEEIVDPRIHLFFNKSNLGVNENHNKALSSVTSKYFVLVGGDDIFYKDKVEAQYNFMVKNNNYAICGHFLDIINHKSEILRKWKTHLHLRDSKGIDKWLNNGMICGAMSLMYNTDYLNTKYDSRLKYASDWKLIIDILKDDKKFKVLNNTLGAYRKHDHNLTTISYDKCVNDQLLALTILKDDGVINSRLYSKCFSYYHNYAIYIDFMFCKSGVEISFKTALYNLLKFGIAYRFINLRFYVAIVKLIFHKKS
jgi:glycosyltransferase involved in cell wall biosynthesis